MFLFIGCTDIGTPTEETPEPTEPEETLLPPDVVETPTVPGEAPPVDQEYIDDMNAKEAQKQEECANVGGTWREFSNGCVDSCQLERSVDPVMCTMAMKMGCDCGPDQCWNGVTCEPN